MYERIIKKDVVNLSDWKGATLQALPTCFQPLQEATVDDILKNDEDMTYDQLVTELKKDF